MKIEEINSLSKEDSKAMFLKCCGCIEWADQLSKAGPFKGVEEIIEISENIWNKTEDTLRMEAFLHHPKIGDLNSLREKYSGSKSSAEAEQSGVKLADDKTLQELSELNKVYEDKFGFIFIVYATGKSADEMIAILKQRINNSREDEIKIALIEQSKITKLRLEKLL